jgi:hypothetical protein
MKFRTNTNEEKLFKKVAIVCLVLFVILLVIYFITSYDELLRLLVPLFLCIPFSFYISNLLKSDYVEILKDKIILIHRNNNMNIEINIDEIKMIKIPSEKALKRKMRDNKIIIKRMDVDNVLSYSVELEKYIKENMEVEISYYDNYAEALK